MSNPQILICDTEAAAIAAADVLGLDTYVARKDTDWSDTAGERLILWPGNSPARVAAMAAAAHKAQASGAASVKLIQPRPLDPPGFDAAQAAQEGWARDTVDEAQGLMDWLRERAVVFQAPPAADVPDPDAYGAQAPEPPPSAKPVAEVMSAARVDGGPVRDEDLRTILASHETYSAGDPIEQRWMALKVTFSKSGAHANETNAMAVLENHPDLKGMVWFDEFLGRIMTNGHTGPREWADADDVRLTVSMQRTLEMIRIKVSHVRAAVIGYAMAHVRNCAQEWIASHKWDGVERIAHFFPDAFGTPDTEYERAVGRNFWISLVARVMRPGCKVDTMVILEGGQGAGKSSVLKAIAGDWFTVQHESITGKGFFEVLQGKMLVEIAEMDAFGKAEVTRVKQVVSTETDRYRESYGRYAKDHPRHSIFVGTTNKDDWNRDETGARRFWPIKCIGKVDLASVSSNRAQMFAEAYVRLAGGAKWWEMPEAATKAQQDDRREEDPWTTPIQDWLMDIYRHDVTTEQILSDCIQLRRGEHGKQQQMRVGAILRGLGWTKRNSGGRRSWVRPETTTS